MEPCHHCGEPTLPEQGARDWETLCTSCGCVAWIAPGDTVCVSVTKVGDFGVFADIGDDVHGLIHIRELANRWLDHPTEVVGVGDLVDAIVLRVA